MPTNDGKEFEARIGQLLRLSGYTVLGDAMVEGTQVDWVARSPDSLAPITYLVECVDTQENVGIEYVKEKSASLIDSENAHGIVCVMIVASRGFTADARSFAENRQRLILRTQAELESQLIDFSPYRDWYTLAYRRSTGVFNEARLFERYVETSASDGGAARKPLVAGVRDWLEQENNNVLFLLGDYGAGKTSFLRNFAFQILDRQLVTSSRNDLIPLLIPLREFRGAINLRQVITDTLVNDYGVALTSFRAFEHYCSLGKMLLLLDGFDEMASRSDVQTVLDCLTQILLLAETNTKLIVTCRSNFFKSHFQLFDILRTFQIEIPDEKGESETLPLVNHGKVLTLAPLSPDEIRAFIERRFPEKADDLLTQIEEIHDLSDLCRRPVLLDMILSTLPDIHDSDDVVNSAVLYESYTNRWAKRDEWRVKMPLDARQSLCDSLAWAMLGRGLSGIAFPDLKERLERVLSSFSRNPDELAEFANDIQTCSFLVREGEGNQYEFAHKSFMEYFVSRRLAGALAEGIEIPTEDLENRTDSPGSIMERWKVANYEVPRSLTFVEVRDALRTRLRPTGGSAWFHASAGSGRSTIEAALEKRVSEVFEVDLQTGDTQLPFEVTPEIATFVLEWLQMKKVSLSEVIEGSGSAGLRGTLTHILRHGSASTYLEEHARGLARSLGSGKDQAYVAAASAALVRTSQIRTADDLLGLRRQISPAAFKYVCFTIAQEAEPEIVSLLSDLEARGELDDFGKVVEVYGRRNLLPDVDYLARIVTTVKACAKGDDAELALEILASAVPDDDSLLEIVGTIVQSSESHKMKVDAVELLEVLSPESHSRLKSIWMRVDDKDIVWRLQKIEERLRSIKATERDRQKWQRTRSPNIDSKLWRALSAAA